MVEKTCDARKIIVLEPVEQGSTEDGPFWALKIQILVPHNHGILDPGPELYSLNILEESIKYYDPSYISSFFDDGFLPWPEPYDLSL